MPDNQSHTEQGQVERAKRLRDRIEGLRRGAQVPDHAPKNKSIKEQLDERAREQEQEP
ncbi:MAG TPA: hypothetical protein VNX88_03935 [Terriglobales bacterium]|jgi:hypothetical protein|nr:hypothetical protein [Terriglobales bacterium]